MWLLFRRPGQCAGEVASFGRRGAMEYLVDLWLLDVIWRLGSAGGRPAQLWRSIVVLRHGWSHERWSVPRKWAGTKIVKSSCPLAGQRMTLLTLVMHIYAYSGWYGEWTWHWGLIGAL